MHFLPTSIYLLFDYVLPVNVISSFLSSAFYSFFSCNSVIYSVHVLKLSKCFILISQNNSDEKPLLWFFYSFFFEFKLKCKSFFPSILVTVGIMHRPNSFFCKINLYVFSVFDSFCLYSFVPIFRFRFLLKIHRSIFYVPLRAFHSSTNLPFYLFIEICFSKLKWKSCQFFL